MPSGLLSLPPRRAGFGARVAGVAVISPIGDLGVGVSQPPILAVGRGISARRCLRLTTNRCSLVTDWGRVLNRLAAIIVNLSPNALVYPIIRSPLPGHDKPGTWPGPSG